MTNPQRLLAGGTPAPHWRRVPSKNAGKVWCARLARMPIIEGYQVGVIPWVGAASRRGGAQGDKPQPAKHPPPSRSDRVGVASTGTCRVRDCAGATLEHRGASRTVLIPGNPRETRWEKQSQPRGRPPARQRRGRGPSIDPLATAPMVRHSGASDPEATQTASDPGGCLGTGSDQPIASSMRGRTFSGFLNGAIRYTPFA